MLLILGSLCVCEASRSDAQVSTLLSAQQVVGSWADMYNDTHIHTYVYRYTTELYRYIYLSIYHLYEILINQ